ncbi:MAG: DUF928 domain-containing protein [Oscillatoria sp. SIO1A7]|nr:DUF928 domain-containing protein [Oscillatoria sp. SIO1A7]
MTWQKSIVSLTVALKLLATTAGVAAAEVQQPNPRQPRSHSAIGGEIYQLAGFTPPANLGKPPTAGGGSRGGYCARDVALPNSRVPLTPLVPALGEGDEGDWGLTVSERPTFFVYVPATTARQAEFVLRDEDWNDIYRTQLSISGEAGIVRVSMPKSKEALVLGKNYRWHFALVCPESDRGFVNEITVEGWTRRVELDPDLATKLDGKTALTRSSIYADNGIWLDALSALADSLLDSPEDSALVEAWENLLASAGLAKIADRPIVLTSSDRTP